MERHAASSELELSSDLGKRLILKGYAATDGKVLLGDALVWAAKKDLEEEVQSLIRQGADVNFVKMDGERPRTALSCAAVSGFCSIISMLADAGAHLDEPYEGGTTALLYAVWNRHLQAVQLLVRLGASTTCRDNDGDGMLHLAAMKGYTDIISLACSSMEVEVNIFNQHQRTPAHEACLIGKLNTLQVLVSFGANIDMRDSSRRTPLHIAAGEGHAEIMEYLLEHGADPTAADIDGDTPLHMAATGQSDAMVQILLRYNADINIRNNLPERHSPLMTAAAYGRTENMDLLIEHGADSLAINSYGDGLLHLAVHCNCTETVQFLMEKGADMGTRNNAKETPLILAARGGKREATHLLISCGASLDQQDDNGNTALHWAVKKQDKLLIGYLIKHQADIEIEDCRGSTVLMLAAESGYKDIVSLLLGRGANIASKDAEGKTALHLAAQHGWNEVVDILFDHGADPVEETTDGQRPEKLARDNDHDDTADLLAYHTSKQSKTLGLATLVATAAKGSIAQLTRLLDKGDVAVNALDSNGRNALSTAAENGHLESIELLVNRGSQVDGRDANGETALWWASRNGHLQVVEKLLELKASAEVCDLDKQTPLCAAAQRGHDLVVTALVESGGNVNSVTAYGKTPLMFATIAGNLRMVQLLVGIGAEVNYSHCGTTALSLAVAAGHEDIAEFLRTAIGTTISAEADDSRQSEQAETPLSAALMEAAKLGQAAEIARLIKAGADPNDKTSGKTPLISAAMYGHTKAVEVLIGNGAMVDCLDAEGKTALDWAAPLEHLDIIRILYEHIAHLDHLDEWMWTPIFHAASNGIEKAVRLLLDLGVRKDVQDAWTFRTPLWVAAEQGHTEVVAVFLEHGSNIECADAKGRTPLTMAVQAGNWGLCNLLLEKGAQMKTIPDGNHFPLSLAAQEGHESIVGLLIDHGAPLNHEAAECRTPLILAAREGHTMAAKILIEMGADTNHRDFHNRTALSYAKESNHELVVKLLSQASTVRDRNERAHQKMKHKNVHERMQHRYAPLSEGFIRILELHAGKTGDPISFELHSLNLLEDQSLSFEALSYEWKGKVGSVPVQCNQDRLLITPNCVAAIERLRHEKKTRMLWIDAICINQEDKEECSNQVKMMTSIYRSAKTVLMWLGEERPNTVLAFGSIPILAHAYKESQENEAHLKNEIIRRAANIIENKDQVGDSWEELGKRSYFRRAWIFQEIILAGSRGLVVCGKLSSPWVAFNAALQAYLVAWESNYLNHIFAHIHTLQINVNEFKAQGELRFASALWAMTTLDCRDARDRVFATLGIVKPGSAPEADYTKSVQEVFLEGNRCLVSSHGTGHWNLVPRKGKDRRYGLETIEGLPSWALDFTRQYWTVYNPWKGAKDFWRFIPCIPTISGTVLYTNGCILDKIVQTVAITKEKDTFEILKPVLQEMSKRRRGIHDPYPNVGRPNPDSNTTADKSQYRPSTNGRALLSAIFEDDISPENELYFGSYLAWKISQDDDIPGDDVSKCPPPYLQSRVAAWDARFQEEPNTFDLNVCRTMERKHWLENYLIYTEKGHIGVIGQPGCAVGMVVALMGNSPHLIGLRKHAQGPDEWYERGGVIFLYGWNEQNIQTLEDIDENAEVVRLEIR